MLEVLLLLPPPDGVDDGELQQREEDKTGAGQEPNVNEFHIVDLRKYDYKNYASWATLVLEVKGSQRNEKKSLQFLHNKARIHIKPYKSLYLTSKSY